MIVTLARIVVVTIAINISIVITLAITMTIVITIAMRKCKTLWGFAHVPS